jgi:hypothetical protein
MTMDLYKISHNEYLVIILRTQSMSRLGEYWRNVLAMRTHMAIEGEGAAVMYKLQPNSRLVYRPYQPSCGKDRCVQALAS